MQPQPQSFPRVLAQDLRDHFADLVEDQGDVLYSAEMGTVLQLGEMDEVREYSRSAEASFVIRLGDRTFLVAVTEVRD